MRFGVAHDDSLARAAAGILAHVLVVAAAATLAVSTPLPVPPAAAAVEQGSPLFESRCARCHAGGGNSIPFNGKKDLSLKALEQNGYADESAIASLLRNGKGAMPPFDEGPGALNDAETQALASFVLQRAGEGWR